MAATSWYGASIGDDCSPSWSAPPWRRSEVTEPLQCSTRDGARLDPGPMWRTGSMGVPLNVGMAKEARGPMTFTSFQVFIWERVDEVECSSTSFRFWPKGPVSQNSETFRAYFGCHNSLSLYLHYAEVLSHHTSQSSWFFLQWKHVERSAFQSNWNAIWQLAFRARKVLGAFDKQAAAQSRSVFLDTLCARHKKHKVGIINQSGEATSRAYPDIFHQVATSLNPWISYFHFNAASKNSLICDRVGEPTQAEAAILCDRLFCKKRSAKGNSALFQAICWLPDLKTFQNAEFKMQKRSHYQQFLRYVSSLLLGNLCYCAFLVTQICVRV